MTPMSEFLYASLQAHAPRSAVANEKYLYHFIFTPSYAEICQYNAVFRGSHVSVKKTEPGKKRHNFALCSSKNGSKTGPSYYRIFWVIFPLLL